MGGRTIISIVGSNFMRKTGMNPDISIREFYSHSTWVNFIEGKEDWKVGQMTTIGRDCARKFQPVRSREERENYTRALKD